MHLKESVQQGPLEGKTKGNKRHVCVETTQREFPKNPCSLTPQIPAISPKMEWCFSLFPLEFIHFQICQICLPLSSITSATPILLLRAQSGDDEALLSTQDKTEEHPVSFRHRHAQAPPAAPEASRIFHLQSFQAPALWLHCTTPSHFYGPQLKWYPLPQKPNPER